MEKKDNHKTIAKPLAHYLNSSIPSEDVNLWPTISKKIKSQEISSKQPQKLITKKRAYGLVAVAAIFAVITLVGPSAKNLMLKQSNNEIAFQSEKNVLTPKGSSANTVTQEAAPQPFSYPITIVSSSYPVHRNQTFNIVSNGKEWGGQKVKLYYLSDTDTNHTELLYKKVLPSSAQYIGETPINSGKWSFKWQSPSSQNEGYGSFIIAALSNDGILSATTVETLRYNNLDLTPSTAQIGQKIDIRGSGFASGDVRIDLLRNGANGGYDFQTTVGTTHITDGSFDYSFTLPKQVNGNVITSGSYKVEAVIIRPNQARQGIFIDLTVQ